MQYKDEELLKVKKALEEEEKRRESKKNLEQEKEESIYDELVHIIGEEVHFERRIIPELKVSIYMPEKFFRFSDDIAKLLYPMGNTPSHIFGGENINFQLLLSQTTHQVPDTGMKSFMDTMAQLMEVMGPKVNIIEKTILEKNTDDDRVFHIGCMSFVSRAVDNTVYNVQFYISMDGKLLMGNVAFLSKYKRRLIPLAMEVINSIELLEEKSEE